ncbi:MAG TPA: SET domain-containing protein-lysine N-methyltransferase [Candidatus Acidoferrum sp.]|nr:SET domain-containing protein-lysine N-methyltransferase [Candidatus Acidoferrum sp.]
MNARRRRAPKVNPRYARFRVRLGRSGIHSWGVFALEDIPAGQRVMEYRGRRLSIQQAVDLKPPFDRYVVRLSRRWMLDGRIGGSGAERVNHSCDPNLSWRRERGHIFFVSRRRIRAGEELTLRYQYPVKVRRVPCRCGSPKCRGTLRYLVS